MDKNIFRDVSYGMYVVTTQTAGCVINTMTQITSENPIISISLNKNNYTNEKIKEEKKFAVSIISEKSNPNLISVFGFSSSKEKDKFENFNRKMFHLNSKLNKYIARPVHVLWSSIMPKYGIERIQNVYNNIEYPKRLASCLIVEASLFERPNLASISLSFI